MRQPKIQTRVVNTVLDRIQKDNNADAHIESVHLKFPKSLVINGFYQADEQGDTLLYADALTINFSLLNPFRKQVYVDNLKLDGAVVNLERNSDTEDFNFAFLFNKKSKITSTKQQQLKQPYDLDIKQIAFNNTRFNYFDTEKLAINNAYLEKFSLDVKELDLENKSISIGDILIKSPQVEYEVLGKQEKESKPLVSFLPDVGWKIKTKSIELSDGKFELKNKFAKPNETLPLDLQALGLENINLSVDNIQLDSVLSLEISNLSATDNKKLNLKNFATKANIEPNAINLNGLNLALNKSRINGDIALNVRDFKNLPDAINQNSNLNISVHPKDINLFLPPDKQILQPIKLQLASRGNIDQLAIRKLQLQAASISLSANGNIQNLSQPKQANFDLTVSSINGDATAIQQIVPWLTLPEQVIALGNIEGSGTFIGSVDSLNADINIFSDAGNITTNAYLNTKGEEMVYAGSITLPTIDIEKILPNAPISNVGGTFNLDGTGTDLETLNGKVSGKLFSLDFKDYTYKDVNFNGSVEHQIFNGTIEFADSNVDFSFDGELDLKDSIPAIKSRLDVKEIDLQALNLMEQPFKISLFGDVDFTGSDFDNLNGDFNLAKLKLDNGERQVTFDSTLFTFKSEVDFKSYGIESEKMFASAEGNFDPIKWPNEIIRYLSNYVYYINDNDTSAITPQDIKGKVVVKEGFGLTEFLLGTVDIPEDLTANFHFNNTKDILEVNATSSLLGYKIANVKSFNFSAKTANDTLFASTGIDSVLIDKPNININDIGLLAKSTKNNIEALFTVEDEDKPNNAYLNPVVQFLEDSVHLHFKNSYYNVNNEKWPFKEKNELVFKDESIIANDFIIFNDEQYLKIVNASTDLSEALIEFNQIDLNELANIIEFDTILHKGFLTGQIGLKDPLGDLKAQVDLELSSIEVFDFDCDTINIDVNYTKEKNIADIAAVFNDPEYDLTAIGYYNLEKGIERPVLLDLDINQLSLSFLDLILKNEATFDVFGEGDLQFTGSFTEPILLGEAYVKDTANIHIKFLGIDLLVYPENGVREKVVFTENTMDFQSMNVRDPFGNRAYMEGKMSHNHFKDITVDARLFADNFNFLNTTYNDNESFYGRVFGNGSVNFSGLTRNINMDIDMKTMPNSKLSIPLASAGDTKEYNFRFINPNDTLEDNIELEELIEIKGVNLDFDLEVTPDAELELVLNTDSENNMRATGIGDLNLSIDQNKQLSIYGTYNLVDGDYVFSPQNLLNKQFKIENGSNIVWSGKPFEAALDVDATYFVNARVDNILQDSSRASQSVPMDVIINIGGTLNQTDVSFSIQPSRTGIVAQFDEVQSFLDEIKNDDGEITTQAISLLLVGRFLPSNSTVFSNSNFSASEFGKTTALELVSNQVSNYLTDAISKLITEVELGFNIIQRDDYTTEQPGQTTTVQLDYSQKFINNRLIVNIGGNFEFVDEANTQGNTIAGDFEVEGILTEDGKLRGKAFHRTADFDIFNQDRSKTGVSISYQKDFDNIREVFKPDPEKKKRRQNKRELKRAKKEDNKENKQDLPSDATKEENE